MAQVLGVDEGAQALGAALRRRRLGMGLTLVRLATAAELSHPFLSQLERGLARPSMSSLERIAEALGTSVVELLGSGPDRREAVDSHVLRRHEGVVGPYGLGTARMLGPELLTFVPMECTGTNTELGRPYVHDEDEFLTVVAGAVELRLGDAVHLLDDGDSAVVAGGTPHCWRSPDGAAYRLVIVKEGAGVAQMRDDLRRTSAIPEDWSR